jgi:hypothetical protein
MISQQQGVKMELITGALNKRWLHNLVATHTPDCSEVIAAIAYASADKLDLFEACKRNSKPVTYYGRYDESVPVAPAVVKWFLDQRSPNFTCRMVPDVLHAKVIWWVGVGVYIGSANLTNRAWTSNIEAGTFVTDEELACGPMLEELRTFFDVTDAKAESIDDQFYQHLLGLERQRKQLDQAEYEFKSRVKRYFPEGAGLVSVDKVKAQDRAFAEFARRWRESLQVLKDISQKCSLDVNRPDWIPKGTPAGAQADQFVHAYYYQFVRGHMGGNLVETAYAKHRLNPAGALDEALAWWKRAEFDNKQERRSLLEWAPQLKDMLSRARIGTLSKDEFCHALSMVHAVIDYGRKRSNSELGLPSTQQDTDTKVRLHAEQLWEARSPDGKSPLEMLEYVIWDAGAVEGRIWAAARSDKWRLPWVQFSTLGEIVGWARPDDFPPRNDRTLKGLRALGFSVRSV